MIALARMVAGVGLCNYDTIYSSISYLIGSVTQFARLYMDRVFQSYLNVKKEREAYEGADALSTAIFVGGEKLAAEICRKIPDTGIVVICPDKAGRKILRFGSFPR